MADAVVAMKATFDGRNLQRGLSKAKAEVKGFQAAVGAATSFLKGPLGFLGVGLAVHDLISRLKELGEEERQMIRLTSAVKRFSGAQVDSLAINARLVTARRNTLYGDTEMTEVLQKLTQITNDYQGAQENLTLVLDLAAATGTSLASATKMVGFAMEGIVSPLGRVSPKFRLWAQDNIELEGTLEAATIALRMLHEEVDGAAGEEAGGFTGAMKHAKEGWDEWVDSILEGSGKIPGALKAWGDYWEMVAEANRLQAAMTDYWGERDRKGGGFGTGPPQLGALPIPPPEWTGAAPPSGFNRGDAPGFSMGNPVDEAMMPGADIWQERVLAAEKVAAAEQRSFMAIMESVEPLRKTLEIRGEIGNDAERIEGLESTGAEMARESAMQTEQMASYLGAQFTNVFFDIENGWKSMLENMAKMMVQKGLTSLFMKLLTGGGSGIVDVSTGGFMGIPFFGKGSSSYGSSRASYNMKTWQNARQING